MKTQALQAALRSAALLLALPAGAFAYGWEAAAVPTQEMITPNRSTDQGKPPVVEAPKAENPADKTASPEKDKQNLSEGSTSSGSGSSGSGSNGSTTSGTQTSSSGSGMTSGDKGGVSGATDEALTRSGEKIFDGGKGRSEAPVVPASDTTQSSGTSSQQGTGALPIVKGLDTSFPVPPPSLGVEMKGTKTASVGGAGTETASFDDWTQAIKKRLSGAWDSVSSAVTGTIDTIKELLAKLGDAFRKAFMAVWQAADTKSIGTVNHGALANGIAMPEVPYWKVINRRETWGTKHMILGLMYIGGRVSLDGAPVMRIGDISDSNGGKLGGHKSHQAGLDVDIPFFYKGGVHDVWANYRVLYHLCNNPFFKVTIAFVSPRVKQMLLAAAKKDGHPEVASWAQQVLNTNEPGHDNHFHVRISPQSKLAEWMQNIF
ncbi:MAG: hypothetical protein A2X36_04520 [Elusimicrobia bacterium GWA2_69_24]|nr:MAG: hypothetical protein A2X36_04520 [Elusimicrobia bacterium GWA2_69_24]HBL17133.1 hypothetical protein [Elusimicrobiota bacterium]